MKRIEFVKAIESIVHSKQTYMDILWDIVEFNNKFEVKLNSDLQVTLINEEVKEWFEELYNNGITPNLLKETADVIYVLEGMNCMNGWRGYDENIALTSDNEKIMHNVMFLIYYKISPIVNVVFTQHQISEAFNLVHKSNMSKLDRNGEVIRREDGKVMKGPDYRQPDLTKLVTSNEWKDWF